MRTFTFTISPETHELVKPHRVVEACTRLDDGVEITVSYDTYMKMMQWSNHPETALKLLLGIK